ncbi:UDP-glycosyltransferase UGT5-like [Culicoides brevitarsis]|uniref:UDP-glycosyltransferase UGT5-like n=1 Tax=Culicoides brevitarsis TaxID=469753 RepID=UPI00307BF22B
MRLAFVFLAAFCVWSLPQESSSYKILGVFPTFSKSHYILGSKIMRELAEKGHEVTVLTPFILNKGVPNLTEVLVDGIIEKSSIITDHLLEFDSTSMFGRLRNLYFFGLMMTNHTMDHPKVKQFLKSDAKFDVIVLEIFVNDAMLGFGSHFKAPVVGISTFGANNWVNEMVGTPSPLSYNPHFNLEYMERMTFMQRVHNFFVNCLDYAFIKFFFLPAQKKIYENSFPAETRQDFDQVLKKSVSFVLLNSHYTTSYPRPYVPNMVEIGGAQINRKQKSLPTDVKRILDAAHDGAIYFSMGTNIESTRLPQEKRDAILKTFAKFPKIQFLWKWEDPKLPGKPSNVHIQKWWPQDDLLGHPNIRCFITHGGLLSTAEANYHGIPIIGIPVFGDQDLNMARAQNMGYGVSVKYKNLTEASLTWALTEILNNKKYKENAREIAVRYRDQPMTPLDTATYWIEYVARHKGATFMQSPAQDLGFFSYHLLDVFAFLGGIVFVFVFLLKILFCKKSKKVGNEVNNNKTKVNEKKKKK